MLGTPLVIYIVIISKGKLFFQGGIMLGENLKKIRIEKGLSIRELQRMSGVSHTIIMNIESGKSKNPTIIPIMKLAKTLEVTINELIYGEK